MAGESLDGFRSFQDVRLYHALERLESTVESIANLASAVLHIPKQGLALKYKAEPSFMDSRPHGNLQKSWKACRSHALIPCPPAIPPPSLLALLA